VEGVEEEAKTEAVLGRVLQLMWGVGGACAQGAEWGVGRGNYVTGHKGSQWEQKGLRWAVRVEMWLQLLAGCRDFCACVGFGLVGGWAQGWGGVVGGWALIWRGGGTGRVTGVCMGDDVCGGHAGGRVAGV
jgi:hypothetical protein